MHASWQRSRGPIVPYGPNGTSDATITPALHHAYREISSRGRPIVNDRIHRLYRTAQATPALIAGTALVAALATGWADGTLMITVTTVSAIFVAMLGFTFVLTYDERINDWLGFRLNSAEPLLRAGLRTYDDPGSLPAGVLHLTTGPVVDVAQAHAVKQGLDASDCEVLTVLLNDGFSGTLDEVLAIARNLRS